nr:PREDICTED: extended synaptotagmin-3-like [Latimeria chalumnae]|eukprot:XP_014341078.1 PREDICTED: extended synaptotagmin-3-like [Latimeria chalumnae]
MKSGAESKERSRRSLSPGGSSSSSSGGGSEPSDLEEGEQPGAVNQLVLEMLVYLGRALVYLFPVYLAGYLGLSLSWVLLGLFLWMSWRRKRKGKQGRLTNALELLEDEKVTIAKQISQQELPPWVTFPDIERVEWINKILLQAWPYFGMYMEKIFRDSIEPAIRGSNLHLKGFTFTKVNLGEKALRITGVKAYTKEVDRRQVILDFQLSYAGDCEVNVEVKKLCKAGVKGIQLHGTLRVILEPLIRDMPLVGAVTMFFIRRPVSIFNYLIYFFSLTLMLIGKILSIEEPNPDSVYTGLSALKKGPLSTKRKKRGSRSEPSPTSSKTLEYPKTQQTDINRNKAEPQLDQKDNVNIPSAISEDALELPTPASSVRTNNTLNRQSVGRETPSVASESSLASSAMDLSERNLHLHNGQAMNEEPLGEIQVTVRYATIRQCLIVVINACRNLISSTSTEGSDPYVRVYLLPDKRWFGRKKTTVKKKTLNPQYDEKFEFVVALEEVKKRKLDIAVKHNKSFTSHERKELGKVLIDLSTEDLVKGFTQW